MKEITAYNLINNMDNYFILDIREHSERVKDGVIPNSYHLPLSTIDVHKIKNILNSNKGKDIVIHCHTGRRSSALINTIIENKIIDSNNIYNLKGGYVLWKIQGGEVTFI
jgi:rhodanese-related sulfurtransferase